MNVSTNEPNSRSIGEEVKLLSKRGNYLKVGFTLIEMLVVLAITAFLTVDLLSVVLRNRLNISEVTRITVSDVRAAQANALSSKQYTDPTTGTSTFRCGYGLYWVNSSSYYLYTGQDPTTGNCSQRHFNTSQSTPIVLTRVLDSRLEVLNPSTGSDCNNAGMAPSDCPKFEDTYFESPDGSIWLNQQHQPNNKNTNRSQILIRKIGATCPSTSCIYICIYAFGKIETRNDMCPKLTN